jgi:hypothetical protein
VDPKDRKDWDKKKKLLLDTIKKLQDEQPVQAAHAKKVRLGAAGLFCCHWVGRPLGPFTRVYCNPIMADERRL